MSDSSWKVRTEYHQSTSHPWCGANTAKKELDTIFSTGRCRFQVQIWLENESYLLDGNILWRSFGRGFSWKYLEQAPIQFCNVVGQLSPSKSLEVVDKDEKADEDGEEQNATNPFFNQSRVGVFLYRFSVGREVGLIPVARKAPFLSIPFQKVVSNFGMCGAFFKAYIIQPCAGLLFI